MQRSFVLGESILQQIRYRFYKQIRYSGKDYSKKLFNALFEHSLSTGKTIIIDKNIKLERVGQSTQWKIDFTNFLLYNCKSSYEWLNHIRLSKLRQLGLLTLRNHLNQQMIKKRRTEINSRLQREVQNHLDKNLVNEKKMHHKPSNQQDVQIFQDLKNLERLSGQINMKSTKEILEEIDFSVFYHEETQLNLSEQKVQNAINELSCLQSSKYANASLDFRGSKLWSTHS